LKSNRIDEYLCSGTSPTPRSKVSKKSEVVPFHHIPIDPSQILTLTELAQRWVYEKSRRRCLNPLPCIRIGRYLRFDWLEAFAWLRQQPGRTA
jgi:hypothetical protein